MSKFRGREKRLDLLGIKFREFLRPLGLVVDAAIFLGRSGDIWLNLADLLGVEKGVSDSSLCGMTS